MAGISRSRGWDKEIPHGYLPMEQLVLSDKWARKDNPNLGFLNIDVYAKFLITNVFFSLIELGLYFITICMCIKYESIILCLAVKSMHIKKKINKSDINY